MLTIDYLPGTPCWIDVNSPDVAASTAFYTGLFGWEAVSLGPAHMDYRFCQTGGKTVAGIGKATERNPARPWTVYFHTPDADAVAKTIEQAGGKILAAPYDIPGQGRMAMFADPAGAMFAVWQPGATKGLGLVAGPGSLGWIELYSPDPAGIRSFYEAVFGWQVEEMPMGDTPYPIISPAGGGESSSMAGIWQTEPGDGAHWLPYFEVSDCDATMTKAQRFGGTVRSPATTVEGVGRMGVLVDPFSARFAVLASSG
ncbi:VOC family protein [Nonomuraea sp. B12E4]|uniref:VOC family protein n=1 Tax=Nonomuraea sp. B12E4 TaxID=3153564 RepID=UPI00325E6B61